MNAEARRIDFLDTARALCMIWIVGVWHIPAYIQDGVYLQNQYTEYITMGVLVTFTFISGFFLGGGIHGRKDVIRFYERRLKRFYPLLLLSCVSLYIPHLIIPSINYIDSVQQLILSITGLACFIGEMPLTVWFFSMMIIFYALTPIITTKNMPGRILASILIWIVFVILYSIGFADERVILYFPYYCLGLCLSQTQKVVKGFRCWYLIPAGILGAVLTILSVYCGEPYFLKILANGLIAIFIISISRLLSVKGTRKVFQVLSYASMCTYLFHRQFYSCVQILFGELSYWAAYIFDLPLCIAFGYLVQFVYDRLVVLLENKRVFGNTGTT